MKRLFNKFKELFKQMCKFFKEALKSFNNLIKGDDGTATVTFIFYLFFAVAATVFFIRIFSAFPVDMAFFLIGGSWVSVEVIKHFFKDFIGLIKFYFKNRNI